MKTDFSFKKYTVKKYSFRHFLLSFLLDSKYKSWSIELAFKILAEIQLVALLLSFPFDVLDNNKTDTFGTFGDKIAHYLSFAKLFQFNTNQYAASIVLSLIVLYSIILFLYFWLLAFFFTKNVKPSQINTIIWTNLCILHYTILFQLILQFTLEMMVQAGKGDIYLWNSKKSEVFIIVGVLITLLNITVAYVGSKYSYEPIRNKYKGGLRRGTLDFIGVIYKTLDPLILNLVTNIEVQKWIRLVIMGIVIPFRLRQCLTVFPYFYFKTMRIFLGLYFMECAFVIINIIAIIINEWHEVSGYIVMYMSIFIGIFFLKIQSYFSSEDSAEFLHQAC